jgi:hypothetical protein
VVLIPVALAILLTFLLNPVISMLRFIGVLMGDESPLETHTSYYQRLIAKDDDEAAELA